MLGTLKMEVKSEEIIEAVKRMKKEIGRLFWKTYWPRHHLSI